MNTQASAKRLSLRFGLACCLAALFAAGLFAQTLDTLLTPGASVDASKKSAIGASATTTENNTGLTLDQYAVRQTAEFGGRIADYSGNQSMWDSYVNLGSGPRLLEYSLNLHSEKHNGLLFDDLNFNNFGYGGDPDNVTRLQFSKGKWYDFDGLFRRDQNNFDYNLLANPLNPSTSTLIVNVDNSPHAQYLTHRMTDLNLRILPLSPVRFRLGYSHNVEEGNALGTIHEGTEALLSQPTQTITDNYRFGISVRVLPRTFLNYDQFFTHSKGNTWNQLNSLPYLLAGNIPVDLGISSNTAASQPCATPILGTGFVNPACNGFFSYTRLGDNRLDFPTEQASFQSNYFPWLDLSGRFSYSKAENAVPSFDELFNGLISRTRQRSFSATGNSSAERVDSNGDFGATIHVNNRLRLVDHFLYDNFRIPGAWNLNTSSLFAATLLSTPNAFNPATCPPPFTAATCPQHSAASSADLINDVLANFLQQQRELNTFTVEYDFTPGITAYAGYRYENRDISDHSNDIQLQTFYPTLATRAGCTALAPDGTCTVMVPDVSTDYVPINTNSAIAGVNARITKTLKLHFDAQFDYADNAHTRISPRHLQLYRLTADYKPLDWVTVTGGLYILENRNTADAIGNLQHNRSYNITAQLAPHSERYGIDLTYDYNDIFSQTNICYVASPAPAGAVTCGATYLAGVSLFSSLSNYGSGSLFFRPIPRLTTWIGYAATSAVGSTFTIDTLSPTGPLTYRYQLPLAAANFNVTKGLAFKSSWNYYDYHEYSGAGPTLPRSFRGNVYTLSLRYAF